MLSFFVVRGQRMNDDVSHESGVTPKIYFLKVNRVFIPVSHELRVTRQRERKQGDDYKYSVPFYSVFPVKTQTPTLLHHTTKRAILEGTSNKPPVRANQ